MAHLWVNAPVPLFEECLRFLHDNGYHVIALRDVARYLPAGARESASPASR